MYKLAEQYPKKYDKVEQKRAEKRKIADQENIPLQPPSALKADLNIFFNMQSLSLLTKQG